jgi:TPP-dependent pyruvate/acetoin dehydrogenase alpha subunit
MAAVTAGEIVARAQAMEIPTQIVDGMDVQATRAAALEVTAAIRAGDGPVFVEARTYRFVGHSRSDPGRYRPDGELDIWRARDPLALATAWLREHGEERRVSETEAAVEAELTAAESAALDAPFPEPRAFSEFKT